MIVSTLVGTFDDSMFLESVTNSITSLFANIGCEWCLSLIYFPPPSIDTNIKAVFKGVTIDKKCYCPNNMPSKFWFNNIWFVRDPLINWTVSNIERLCFSWSPLKDPTSCADFTDLTVNFSSSEVKKRVRS